MSPQPALRCTRGPIPSEHGDSSGYATRGRLSTLTTGCTGITRASGLVCREDCSVLACDLHDAEAVAVGIFQHDEIFIRTVCARVPGRPDLDQALHFALLVVGVEIQVHSAHFSNRLEWFSNLLQRHVWPSAPGIAKNHPAVVNRHSGNVMECLLPERQHPVELVTTYNYRSDFHCSHLKYGRHPNQVDNDAAYGSLPPTSCIFSLSELGHERHLLCSYRICPEEARCFRGGWIFWRPSCSPRCRGVSVMETWDDQRDGPSRPSNAPCPDRLGSVPGTSRFILIRARAGVK